MPTNSIFCYYKQGGNIMITILNAGNYKVADGLILTTLSLAKHTKEPICMKCLTMDLQDIDPSYKPITNECAEYVDKILKTANKESHMELIDATQIFKTVLGDNSNMKTICTPYTLLRLLADKIDLPDKYIYLDTDVLVNRDIALLFNQDIDGFELGVVRDAYRISKTYFNAGVMLVNHKECLKTGLYEKARYLIEHKKMLYADQDALNKSCTKRKMLPLIFNAKDKYYPEIVVHHFCNVRKKNNWFHRIKPWHVDLVKTRMSAYNDILDDYVARKNQPDWPNK